MTKKYEVFNKKITSYHLNIDDSEEKIIPPSSSVTLSEEEYNYERVQRSLNKFENDFNVTEIEVNNENSNTEDSSSADEEESPDDDIELEDKDRGELMSIASDLNYSDKNEESIVKASSDELVKFIKENQ